MGDTGREGEMGGGMSSVLPSYVVRLRASRKSSTSVTSSVCQYPTLPPGAHDASAGRLHGFWTERPRGTELAELASRRGVAHRTSTGLVAGRVETRP